MLDIYYAPPSTRFMPEEPGHLEFAGSIDLDAHRSLATLFEKSRQAGTDLLYFRDSMLKPAQVTILLQTFMANAPGLGGSGQSLAAFNAIRDLLEGAVSRGMGLVAFSD
ncbi:hypothetical protein MOK15_14655 [Sphingobium sp. BYY-5]|uniref:hypothetical protein n=1 Tax=Sphingobium sp. BYY-5 TaxID=2926400 RepID=UPI001FA722B4|nr:hypothetical protein [Sphingobium sp. BYY-5]MCI4591326.1 hypothetical protein [Sphingobium sp. BYY-5]